MSGTRHRGACVSQAVLDLRRAPDHRSELMNQLLLGESVTLLGRERAGGWQRVRSLEDGYRGWVKGWGLTPLATSELARWQRRARHRVVSGIATIRSGPGRGPVLGPVTYGARLIRLVASGRWARVGLPDGREGWLPAADLAPAGRPTHTLLGRLDQLLGSPYLWGGRTPLGLDCSALTQLVYAEQGVALPRDAHHQYRACRRLGALERLRAGDLVFFSSRTRGAMEHVAILLGKGLYAHARGTVRKNSLDPANPLFDSALAGQLRAFGRAHAPRRSGGSRPR